MEFVLDEATTHEDAWQILSAKQPTVRLNSDDSDGKPRSSHHKGRRATVLDDIPEFGTLLGQGLMRISKATLSAIPKGQVIVQTCSVGLMPPRYFLAVDPNFAIMHCTSCNHFFEQEEWDLRHLREGECPFCKASDASSSAQNSVVPILTAKPFSRTEDTASPNIAHNELR